MKRINTQTSGLFLSDAIRNDFIYMHNFFLQFDFIGLHFIGDLDIRLGKAKHMPVIFRNSC